MSRTIRQKLWFQTMANFVLLISLLLHLADSSISVSADRIKHKIYSQLDSTNFCFRRLNGTHQIGCSSSEGGNYGIAKQIRDSFFQDDLEFITTHGADPPYVAILTSHHFDLTTLLLLKKASNRVSGVVVVDQEKPAAFTADRSCPNEHFSLYRNDSRHANCRSQQWNVPSSMNHHRDHQEGILFYDWPFPIFLLRNRTEIEFFLNKTNQFKYDQWPKLAIELVSPMSGAKDSVTCMRRSIPNTWMTLDPEQYCDPMGGINIYHHTLNLSSIPESKIPNNSVIVLGSRMDSFSMFDNLAPGADSAMSSLISLLAIAELFNRDDIKQELAKKGNNGVKSVMFSLFDGEAFDYIGSSFAVDQLERSAFKLQKRTRANFNSMSEPDGSSSPPTTPTTLSLDHLSHYIELNQLANYNNTKSRQKLYLHRHLHSTPQLDDLIRLIELESKDLPLLDVESIKLGSPLPPSSAQSFLKKRKDANFSAVVVTNHEREYINQFYNSFYEDNTGLSFELAKYLADISTLFGRVAYKLVTGKPLEPNIRANETLIHDMIKCFLKTSSCELFHIVQDPAVASPRENEQTFPSYVSVYEMNEAKVLRLYTLSLFHFLTGERMESANSSQQCHQLADKETDSQYNYLWMNGRSLRGECIRSTAYSANSISPAFNPATYEVIFEKMGEYSIWTESKWKINSLLMFVVSSRLQQILTLILGLIILILSFIVVLYFSRNSLIYFDVHNACAAAAGGGDGDVASSDAAASATLVKNTTATTTTITGQQPGHRQAARRTSGQGNWTTIVRPVNGDTGAAGEVFSPSQQQQPSLPPQVSGTSPTVSQPLAPPRRSSSNQVIT